MTGGDHGLEDSIRGLADDGRKWVAIGTVDKIETHAKWGYLLTVTERPSGRQVQARVVWLGLGPAEGVFATMRVGAEVVLLYPEGRANRAVALVGLPGGDRVLPTSFDNAHIDLVHEGGVEVRTDQSATVEAVQKAETFQDDLDGFLAALNVFMMALQGAVSVANIVTAATAFAADPRVTGFKSSVGVGAYSAASLSAE